MSMNLLKFFSPLFLAGLSGCSFLGLSSQYEEASHSRVNQQGDFEIREYKAMVVAQTTVEAPSKEAGNKAFRTLFSYISGNNLSQGKIDMTTPVFSQADEAPGEKIAMTTPVFSEAEEPGRWRYQFVLPDKYSLESAPQPKDPAVELAAVPAGRCAVIRYAGRWNDELRKDKTRELREWMKEQGLAETSSPRYAAYDPPWTLPAFRRNEVLIDIEGKKPEAIGNN